MRLKWYLIIISICIVIISSIVSLTQNVVFIETLLITCLSTLFVIIIDGITATISRLLPQVIAKKETDIFKVTRKERNFYSKLQIKKWKDKIPEIGHFTGFRKNKISDPKNPEYIKRFIIESAYGEIGHFLSVFTGVLLLLIPIFPQVWFSISLGVMIVNSILNIPPIIVLRYNKFTLLSIYKKMKN